MANSSPINKEKILARGIRFKLSEHKKIDSLRRTKKGKLEPWTHALHRFLKNAIYLDPEELNRVNETTQEYGILPTPNNPKTAIMRFIEIANPHNGDNSSKLRKPSNPKRYSQPSRQPIKQTSHNFLNTTLAPRTMFNGGSKQQRDCPMGGGISCEVCHVRAYEHWVKCQKIKQGLPT